MARARKSGHACVMCGKTITFLTEGTTCSGTCRAKWRETRKSVEWRVKKQYPDDVVDRVRVLYIDRGMSQQEIADDLGVSRKVIYRLMKNHEIPRRAQVKRDQRGSANSSWKGDAPGYRAAHWRVKASKGRAAQHACADCGAPANEWSYIGGCPREQIDPDIGCAYSIDPDRYTPRCTLCHRRHDAALRKENANAKR